MLGASEVQVVHVLGHELGIVGLVLPYFNIKLLFLDVKLHFLREKLDNSLPAPYGYALSLRKEK